MSRFFKNERKKWIFELVKKFSKSCIVRTRFLTKLLCWCYQGTLECKLLSSVYYDLGKKLAETHPMLNDSYSTSKHFLNAVDGFSVNFPNLHVFTLNSNFKIPIGSRNYSCLAFLRMNARNGAKSKKT